MDSLLFQSLKLDDPIWIPPKPWESIRTESGSSRSDSSRPQRCQYDTSAISEASLVRLAMNAMYGFQSALVSIEKLSTAFCSEPADRTFHRISSLWNRSLSTDALGKLLKSIGCCGSVVFLLREFVGYFTSLNLDGNAFENLKLNSAVAANQNHCNSRMSEAECLRKSLVNQAFGVAVGKVLEGYICALDTLYASVVLRHASKTDTASSCASSGRGCLMAIVHSKITLLEVYLHTKELMTHIQAIGNICNLHHVALCFPESSVEDLVGKAKLEFHNFPRGGDLLTYLHNQLQVADPPKRTVLKFLFLRSCEPYCRFIRSWIFKAEISDPYKEFIVEDVNSYGKGGISFDFPMASVKVRHGSSLPCFLKDFLVPMLRAGQQLQVLKKMLELCNFVTIGDHKYEDILPCWTGFSSNHPSFASPLTFNKGNIEDLVFARRKFYKMMWQNLDNSVVKLQLRYQQVAPVGMISIFANRGKTTVPDSFALDGSMTSSSATCKRGPNVALDDVGSKNYNATAGSEEVDPSELSETSSSVSSEGQNEQEQLIEPANSLVHLKDKHFSPLLFSTSISTDNSSEKPMQSKKSETLESNSMKISDGAEPFGHFVHSRCTENSLSNISMPLELGKPNCSAMAGSQYSDGEPDMCWPVGCLQKNPFNIDKGCKGNEMLNPSEFFFKVHNGNKGAMEESSSIFSKISTADNPQNDMHHPFILDSQKIKLQCNFVSVNPMLSKHALFQIPTKPGEEFKAAQKENISYFDFSFVQNPCKEYIEKFAVSHERHFGDELHSSLVSSVSAKNGTHKLPNRRSCCRDVPSSGLIDHSSESIILPNVAGGTTWESLLTGSSNAVNDFVGDHEQNLVPMFEIPIDFIIDKCLLQEVLLQYKYISKLTIKLLEEGFNFQEHLLALRRYHFMELADWAELFITSLWHHKSRVMGAEEKISEIQGLLEMSVQRSSCGTDNYKDRLYVYNKGHGIVPISVPAIGLHSLDFIGLGYRVDWPVSIALTPDSLTIYGDIFSFLMQVKLAVISLTDVWTLLKESMHLSSQNPQSDKHEHKTNLNILIKMRHQVNHFVSTLHQYVQSQLSHVSWFKFLHSLKHKVKDMMDLESVHMAYLTDALHICFLSRETQSVALIIENILQCALDFRSCLLGGFLEDGLYRGNLLTKLSQVNISQVLDLRAKFDKNLKQLHLHYLKSLKHAEFGLPRFWGFLNYNEYYSGGIGNDMGTYAFSS